MILRPVDIALTYEGMREVGGNNRGPEVERFLRMSGKVPGLAWCAAFVSACIFEAYQRNWAAAGNTGPFDPKRLPVPMTAGVWVMWTSADRKIRTKEPSEGDVFIMNCGIDARTGHRKGHCGFVTNVKENRVLTIEGNTSVAGSRDGDGVYARSRKIADLHGFIKVNPKEEGFPNA